MVAYECALGVAANEPDHGCYADNRCRGSSSNVSERARCQQQGNGAAGRHKGASSREHSIAESCFTARKRSACRIGEHSRDGQSNQREPYRHEGSDGLNQSDFRRHCCPGWNGSHGFHGCDPCGGSNQQRRRDDHGYRQPRHNQCHIRRKGG
jgi:hypothetical protein